MKTKTYSITTILILIVNVAIIVCGMFFIPQSQAVAEMMPKCIAMGLLVIIDLILLLIARKKKEFSGAARYILILSYILAGLVLIRWAVTIYLTYTATFGRVYS